MMYFFFRVKKVVSSIFEMSDWSCPGWNGHIFRFKELTVKYSSGNVGKRGPKSKCCLNILAVAEVNLTIFNVNKFLFKN